MSASKGAKFIGFDRGALRFLSGLKRHNDREWFLKNKHVYESEVKQPLEEVVNALAADFERIAPDMAASRKESLFRIHRDTRFSHDKTPYKTHAAAVFPNKDLGKNEGAAFYFHFDPTELLVGGGLYMPLPEDLRAVREHIADNTGEFELIIKGRRFKRVFGQISGDQLVRPPRGFAPDHPAMAYLRQKQFLAMITRPGETVTTNKFYPLLLDAFETLYPLVRFLNDPIRRNRKRQERQNAFNGRAATGRRLQ